MDITAVIINYQTPDLLQTAVQSFKDKYPQVPLIIVDNGSLDDSPKVIEELIERNQNVEAHYLERNIYHGPAMDLAARTMVQSKYIFFLDSDTETLKSGFLEAMHDLLEPQNVYGVGEFLRVNKRGFKSEEGISILMTPHMLLKRKIYLKLPPFKHHGQPTLENYTAAHQKGYELRQFQISDYIYHHWRGTSNRFGYGLGLKGKIDFILNKLGI